MSFSIKAGKKNQEVLDKVKNLGRDVKIGIGKGFEELGSNLVRTAENQALNEPKFGREYEVKTNGVKKLHRASKAGQSPAILSGNYFENFKYENRGEELEFGNDAEYSEYLEDGTEKMEPRTGVQNAVSASVRNARLYLEENIGQSLEL